MQKKAIILSIFILIATAFMSVGFAAINMSLDIGGTITANAQRDIFIVEPTVTATSNVSNNIEINQIYKTILDSTISLNNANSSYSITYKVTVHNNTSSNYAFKGIVADNGTYNNSQINYSYSGIDLNEIVASGASKTFTVTLSNNTSTSNELRSYMNIAFGKNCAITYDNITISDGIQTNIAEGLTYINTFENPPDDIEITMGGTTLTKGTDYTYSNGTLTIPNVTDNLLITGITNQDPYSIDITESKLEYDIDLNHMSFDEFLEHDFTFNNNSGKTINKLTLTVTGNVQKVANGTANQYITTTLIINGKSSGTFPSVVLSTYSTTVPEEVTSQARTKSVTITNGSNFSIDFSATKNKIISVIDMVSMKVIVGY